MRLGIACLIFSYVLSQFYRAFLAVLTPMLEADLGMTKADLATASGAWFLAFALMQFPVGAALDRLGPRLTASAGMTVGTLGALLFALAGTAWDIKLAMALIGVGCSPVLMASYYIFAREFSLSAFATLAAATIGIGSLGNIAASLPLTAAAGAFGWRETVFGLAAITAATGAAVFLLVRDPARVGTGQGGSVLSLLRIPQLWPILAMMFVCYAPAAGLRGLWLGPYFTDVWGYARPEIGQAGLWMGLAMVAGSFAYGPLDRWFGTLKWVIWPGNALMLACLAGLALWPGVSPGLALWLLIGVGFFGSTFPLVIAHSKAFFPPHLMGRGVTLVNFFGIASAGLAQEVTGRIHGAWSLPGDAALPYQAVFGFFALAVALGLAVYLLSQDRRA